MPKGIYTRTLETRQKMREAKLLNPTRYWKDHPMSDEQKLRLKTLRKGVSNAHYLHAPPLKENAGKRAIHNWVGQWKGKPDTCEKCGKSGLSGVQINWANIDHKYRRVLDDYIRLCSKCHGEYDTEHGLRKRKGVYLTFEELERRMSESRLQTVSDNQKSL